MNSIITPGKPGIYQIKCSVNDKFYIGSAVNLSNRRHNHFYNLQHGIHHNQHLQNAYNKYGEDSFEFTILEFCEHELLIEREQYYIDTLKPQFNKRLIAQSCLGMKNTEESKRKMSATVKGRKKTADHLEKIAAARRGKMANLSPEGREALKKKKKHSQETKDKISASWKSSHANFYVKKRSVHQIDPDTERIIATFKSASKAARAIGLSTSSHITATCQGKCLSSGGFKWQYADEADISHVCHETVEDIEEIFKLGDFLSDFY